MKFRIFALFLVLVSFSVSISAQDCNAFYRFNENATYEYGYYDKKGKPEGRELHRISNLSTDADGTVSAELHSKLIPEKKNADVFESNSTVTCKDGILHLDLSMNMSSMMSQYQDMEVSLEGTPLEIPYDLKVGQTLPDATTKVKTGVNGMNLMSVTMSITDRNVEAKEKITTPAGTFDCFKISQTTSMKTIISKTFTTVDYYAEGVGLVRSETYSKNGKLESSRELLSLTEE
jgi:hypothetical protein